MNRDTSRVWSLDKLVSSILCRGGDVAYLATNLDCSFDSWTHTSEIYLLSAWITSCALIAANTACNLYDWLLLQCPSSMKFSRPCTVFIDILTCALMAIARICPISELVYQANPSLKIHGIDFMLDSSETVWSEFIRSQHYMRRTLLFGKATK